MPFGLGKFLDHTSEVDSFETYGLPSPDAFVYAIAVSGIGEGEPISLSVAPALFVAMLYLLWRGPGDRSLDARLRRRAQLSTSGL